MASNLVDTRKKTLAATSSASYNPYLFRSFCNEERYLLYPKDKTFVQEKAFKLNKGEFDDIQANILNRGWGVLTSYAEPGSRQLGMEFFANAYQQPHEANIIQQQEGDKDQAKYTSYVRGQTVSYTPAVINRLLGLQNIEQCAYEQRLKRLFCKIDKDQIAATLCIPGKDWERNFDGTCSKIKTTKLNPTAKAWSTFVFHTLLSSSNVSKVTIFVANLVTAIMLGEPINIGRILATELHATASCDPKGAWLNHASLISRLCELVGVKAMMNEVMIKSGPPITKKWIDRYCIPFREIPAIPGGPVTVLQSRDHMDAHPQQQHLDRLERLEKRVQQVELSQREGQARLERGLLALYRAFASYQAGHSFDHSPDIFASQDEDEDNGVGGQDEDVSNRPPVVRTYSRRKAM